MPGVGPTEVGSPSPSMGDEGAPSGTPSGDGVKPEGNIELAKANVLIALSHLEKQLPMLGSDSEEGKALLSAISTLAKKFSGKKSENLVPAELMSLMSSQPDSVQQAMMKEMGGGAEGSQPPIGGMPPQGM